MWYANVLCLAHGDSDFAHFSFVHGNLIFPWSSFRIPGVTICHKYAVRHLFLVDSDSASWEAGDPHKGEKHLAYFNDEAHLVICGKHFPQSRGFATITFIGPGSISYFRFRIPGFGHIILAQTHLPLSPMELKTEFMYAECRQTAPS